MTQLMSSSEDGYGGLKSKPQNLPDVEPENQIEVVLTKGSTWVVLHCALHPPP